MPKTDMDYSRTIMYKIVCNDPRITDCYVGHTTNFRKRKASHKSTCNNEKSKDHYCYVYQFIRDNGGWDNFSMIQIEEHPCNNSNEACSRERYWLESLGATLNQLIPARTYKEWYEEYRETHREELLEKNKEYRETHREELLEKDKEYRETHKEEISEKKKEYWKNHKEVLSSKKKEYYETNKEKISEQRKIKIECECGCIIRKLGMKIHMASPKHLNFLNAKSNLEI